MRKQKLAVDLRVILFHVQSIHCVQLTWGLRSAVEQVPASTDWRNASLSSRRKPEQRVVLLPGHWQPHYTVFHLLVSWEPFSAFLSHILVLATKYGGNFNTDATSFTSTHFFFEEQNPFWKSPKETCSVGFLDCNWPRFCSVKLWTVPSY